MADRSVVVRLRADIAAFEAGMKRAKTSAAEFGREVSGSGKTAKADVEAVGRTALIAGGVMAIGFGKGIQVAMGFEKQMSGVKAVSGASADEMHRLSDAAIAAGASTKLAGVTASDAAAAEAELVKAGVSVSDVLGGALTGSLTLAAAGQIDFANAATIAAQAMNIFDLKGGAVTHIADVLAAAANKSASDVGGLGDALRQGGLVAAQTGLSLEETVGALAAFADNALIGSDAGTSLKTMLQRLTPTSKEAADLMEQIGFSAYDAQGNFIGLEGLADELQTSMAGMTIEQRNLTMATLFGSDAVRAANVLYEEGAAGVKDYTDAVNDQGAAARMAAIQNDNLTGDVEALGGAIESALIQNGSKANDAMRFITQGATDLVTGFSAMPDLLQTSAMGIGGIATAGTIAVGVLGTFVPKINVAKDALTKMGTSGKFLADNMGKMAGGLGVLGAGFSVFAAWEAMMADAKASAEDAATVWEGLAFSGDNVKSLDDFSAALGRVKDQERSLREDASASDAPWDRDYREELRAGADELGNIGTEMARVIDTSAELARQLGISRDAAMDFVLGQRNAGVDVLADDYDTFTQAMVDAYGQMPAVSSGVGDLTGEIEDNAVATKAAEDAFKNLMDAYRASVDPLFGMLDALDANREAQKALTDAWAANSDELEDNNVSLEELDRLNRNAASSALDVMSAAQELAHQVDIGNVSLGDARTKLQEWVDQGLITEGQAQAVGDQFGIAAQKAEEFAGDYVATAQMKMDASQFHRELDYAKWRLASMGITGPAGAYVLPKGAAGPVLPLPQGPLQGATGGVVSATGIDPIYRAMGGPSGTDTVNAWLTPGEYVVQKSAVDRFGVGFMDAINRGLSPATGGGMTVVNQVTVSAGSIVGDHRELVRVVQRGMDEASRLTAGAR